MKGFTLVLAPSQASGARREQGTSCWRGRTLPHGVARAGADSRGTDKRGAANEFRRQGWAIQHVSEPSYIYSKPWGGIPQTETAQWSGL